MHTSFFIVIAIHAYMNDVVTDWSYAVICFLACCFYAFGVFPRPFPALFHIAIVFVGLVLMLFGGQIVE